MYNALYRLALALVALWLEAEEESVEKSVYYFYQEDIRGDDLVPDSRLRDGYHIEVEVRVVKDDEEYTELFARHMARQGVDESE